MVDVPVSPGNFEPWMKDVFPCHHPEPRNRPSVGSDSTTVVRPRCPIMRPDTYDGTGVLEDFLSHFEILSELNNWDGVWKAKYLAASLKGSAQSVLSETPTVDRNDFTKLRAASQRRFGQENQVDLFRAQLQSYKRKRGMTIPEMALNIRKLARRAYPGVTDDMLQSLETSLLMPLMIQAINGL